MFGKQEKRKPADTSDADPQRGGGEGGGRSRSACFLRKSEGLPADECARRGGEGKKEPRTRPDAHTAGKSERKITLSL